MTEFLTSRDVAALLGVSESSLKRWSDHGEIAVTRTPGGHRRYQRRDVLQFARARALGIEEHNLLPAPGELASDGVIIGMIERGDTRGLRDALIDRHHAGDSIATLCDGPLRDGLARVGTLWQHDDRGVQVEHRASWACVEAISGLRASITERAGLLAMGGAPSGDPYLVPTAMCAAVLAEVGFAAINLGPDTPAQALLRWDRAPQAVWVAVSSPLAAAGIASLAELDRVLRQRGVPLLLGGVGVGALPAEVGTQLPDMRALEAVGRDLIARGEATPR